MAIDESGRTEQAKQEAKGYADDLRQRGQHVAEQAKQGAGRVAEEVKDKAHDQADRQMDRAAERLHSVADQLESMTQETDQEGILVDYALNGARRLHSLADHLEQDGIDGIIRDVENFARRRPGMFIAAGMGVGMVLGRWLKSADMDRVKEAMADGSPGEPSREVDSTDSGLGREPVGAGLPSSTPAPTTRPVPGGRI